MSILSFPNDSISFDNPFIKNNNQSLNQENNQNNNIKCENYNDDVSNIKQFNINLSITNIKTTKYEFNEDKCSNISSINDIEHLNVSQPKNNIIEIVYNKNCLFAYIIPLILFLIGLYLIYLVGKYKINSIFFYISYVLFIFGFLMIFFFQTKYTFILGNNFIKFKQQCKRSIIYKPGDIEKIEFYCSYDGNKIRKHFDYLAIHTKEGKKEIFNSRSCLQNFTSQETIYARYIINKHINNEMKIS